jgi:tRNA-specific 2-thiouridylase
LTREGLEARDGAIVDEEGRILGSHEGYWRFTPGQRKGLGVATGSPLYALRSDPEANVVVVGPREALARRHVAASGRLFASVTRGDAKLRYRSPTAPAQVSPSGEGFDLDFDEPVYGVARGQTAVVYDGDVVVASGVVRSSTA